MFYTQSSWLRRNFGNDGEVVDDQLVGLESVHAFGRANSVCCELQVFEFPPPRPDLDTGSNAAGYGIFFLARRIHSVLDFFYFFCFV